MSNYVHHVTLVTREAERLQAFAQAHLAFEVLAAFAIPRADVGRLLGWPSTGPDVQSVLLGSGRAGLLELVQAPRDVVLSGEGGGGAPASQVAVWVTDVDAVLAAADAEGWTTRGPVVLVVAGARARLGAVEAGGACFQVSQPV